MKTQQSPQIFRPRENPLTAIFFVFGAIHAYNSVKTDRRNGFEIFRSAIKVHSPILLLQLFISVCIAIIAIEAIQILQTTLP